ncbi:MAG: hypothetical protein AUJ28_01690 [Parcubacteria group bacterium CG1_02_37_51]|uniref:GIY-YIG domain-containing protein n=2 Tax=Candidatus Komeiliibacteriota TaxID=1817908 RepID=A0A2M8DS36_9BACT|nr:MAG: hypothetical protein AUJ28_01690 [Parcubacteria group bacterium CG1_02_37_51]PIY94516.1 MAG: hypothetical protein COY67_02485 [Candidatus Komeilibacteria bacterium CG_4_10_14_0_8_um_filter_37_78]PJC02197.1 MAG: hypothetical protein CO073_00775 [Candidatus Komeilibacteria bacterium CG_4_9_14_0_8_um_filter_36_9]
MRTGYVYIMTNQRNMVLYVGVTNNLIRRINEHKDNSGSSCTFCHRYNVNKLVYYEEFEDIVEAIDREKQLKAGSRQTKINLINNFNPKWTDLCLALND